MRMTAIPAALGFVVLSVVAAAQQPSARATLQDPKGATVGEITLTQTPGGVLMDATITGLPPGDHAIHLHAVGRCEAPAFTSAGGHYNPTGAEHGFENPKGPHAGDLPNIHVPRDGRLHVEYMLPGVKLEGGATALLDADGAAVVVHARPDDYRTNPAGAAGDRIACGVIRP
jgi:Cu-Zn family superoxide dismutase